MCHLSKLCRCAAALIPFLEHDDANRALMGSNMQRQAGSDIENGKALVERNGTLGGKDSGVTEVQNAAGLWILWMPRVLLCASVMMKHSPARQVWILQSHQVYPH